MTGDEYQILAIRTMNSQTDLVNVALGLAGEAGEFADHIKKHKFHGHTLDEDHLREELGDQLWYIAVGCKLLGVRLSDVMAANIEKLRKRYPDGFGYAESQNRAEYRTSVEDRQKIQATMAARAGSPSVKDGEESVDAILAGESLFGSAESAQPCTVVKIDDTVHRIPTYREPVGVAVDFSKMNGADDLAYYGDSRVGIRVGDDSQFSSVISDNADPIIRTHRKVDFTTGKWVIRRQHQSGRITEEQIAPNIGDEYEYYDSHSNKVLKFRFDAVGKKAGVDSTWRFLGMD